MMRKYPIRNLDDPELLKYKDRQGEWKKWMLERIPEESRRGFFEIKQELALKHDFFPADNEIMRSYGFK